jgi:hypothetical protein
MDHEIRSLLQAVIDGKIQDPSRAREIIAEGKRLYEEWEDLRYLYWRARDAFVEGAL